MKTISTKKLFAFILLMSGMFSISIVNAQTCCTTPWMFCSPGEVLACRWMTGCVGEWACVPQNQLHKWRAKATCKKCGCGCAGRLDNSASQTEIYALSIYPNPVSTSTSIGFYLEQTEKISLKIFDVRGRLITTLADAAFEEGDYDFVWNAADVNAGIYFLRMETASYSENQKLIVAK